MEVINGTLCCVASVGVVVTGGITVAVSVPGIGAIMA